MCTRVECVIGAGCRSEGEDGSVNVGVEDDRSVDR